MNFLQVRGKTKLPVLFLVLLHFSDFVHAYNTAYVSDDVDSSIWRSDVVNLHHERTRRDTAAGTPPPPAPEPELSVANNAASEKAPDDHAATTLPSAVVTKIPLLGVNGSGILKVNLTDNHPKVSDPIVPNDDNITEIFRESPDQMNLIMAQHNVTNLKYDDHSFYNSTFIGNQTYFDEYWANITAGEAEIHPILSNSHRRATTLSLSFLFPFYGHPLRNITVATGGFIYTGEHVHNWLAATQYIAPLMANFDTTGTDDSVVKVIDRDDRFTALWENVALQENRTAKFTFAVTMYKNGDIIFAYKDIPLPITSINEYEHPVKVGISDAYQTDRVLFYVRRKTIYEYHRVTFKDHNITSNTILKLVAMPTCLQYNTCAECVNHNTAFNCSWCHQIQRCSSGTDRNKQDWHLRNCEKNTILIEASCPADNATNPNEPSTTYFTDGANHPFHDPIIRTEHISSTAESPLKSKLDPPTPAGAEGVEQKSSVGGVIAAFLIVALVATLVGWTVYAFKFPHTRSGQFLIKYRPSRWTWKRGEARYTAATIHM